MNNSEITYSTNRFIKGFYLFLLIGMIGCISTVKDINYIPASSMTLLDRLTIIKITLYSGNTPVKTDPSCIYYWFDSKLIHQTQGDYSGILLNGNYVKYDTDGNMLGKGIFVKGLKSGTWVEWHKNGLVYLTAVYKDGQKSGDYSMYNDQGVLMEQSDYENDKLNGKLTRFDSTGNPVLRLAYRNGVLFDTLCADSSCFSR